VRNHLGLLTAAIVAGSLLPMAWTLLGARRPARA
jgi:hypothetical protein